MNARLAHDHTDLGELLRELFDALDAGDVGRSHVRLDLFWARLAMHIRAEHLHLFPTILRALNENPVGVAGGAPTLSEAQTTIEELRSDHDFFMRELARAVQLTRELSAATDRKIIGQQLEDVRAGVAAVSERLAAHNRLEEDRVYLWTGSLLSEAGQSALAARVQDELENMPPRFTAGVRSKPLMPSYLLTATFVRQV